MHAFSAVVLMILGQCSPGVPGSCGSSMSRGMFGASFSIGRPTIPCSTGNCGSQMQMQMPMPAPQPIYQPSSSITMLPSYAVLPSVVRVQAPTRQLVPEGYRVICDGESCRLEKIGTVSPVRAIARSNTVERVPYATIDVEPPPPIEAKYIPRVDRGFQFYKD